MSFFVFQVLGIPSNRLHVWISWIVDHDSIGTEIFEAVAVVAFVHGGECERSPEWHAVSNHVCNYDSAGAIDATLTVHVHESHLIVVFVRLHEFVEESDDVVQSIGVPQAIRSQQMVAHKRLVRIEFQE